MRQHTTAANANGAHRAALDSGRTRDAQSRAHRPSAQLITDAVVANYIRDISVRHGGASRAAERLRGDTHRAPARHDVGARSWS